MSQTTRRRLLLSLPLAALPATTCTTLFSNLLEASATVPPNVIHTDFSSTIDRNLLHESAKEQATEDAAQDQPKDFKGKSQNALKTDFTHCTAFPFASLPLRYSDAGAPTHDILRGTIPTGELVELHETTVAPGKMPHPAHQHPHVEFILIREGAIEFSYQGQTHLLTPGSVGYTAPNELHGFRNAGATPATYFIVSIGKR